MVCGWFLCPVVKDFPALTLLQYIDPFPGVEFQHFGAVTEQWVLSSYWWLHMTGDLNLLNQKVCSC